MTLNKDQKEQLKSLTEHPGFKVWELIEEDARNRLWQRILSADLSNENELKLIQENQIYVKARQDFFVNIKTSTASIYNPLDKLL